MSCAAVWNEDESNTLNRFHLKGITNITNGHSLPYTTLRVPTLNSANFYNRCQMKKVTSVTINTQTLYTLNPFRTQLHFAFAVYNFIKFAGKTSASRRRVEGELKCKQMFIKGCLSRLLKPFKSTLHLYRRKAAVIDYIIGYNTIENPA